MEMGSELMEAPEDEETFDILNDETFGDMGDGKISWNRNLEFGPFGLCSSKFKHIMKTLCR